MPVERPRLAKAENASNIKLVSPKPSSVINNKNNAIEIHVKLSENTAMALRTWSGGTVRSRSSTVMRPEITARIVAYKIANVVVLIPPPVDPGDDPINVTIIIRSKVGKRIIAMSSVVKPALRAQTASKSALTSLAGMVRCAKPALYSSKQIKQHAITVI